MALTLALTATLTHAATPPSPLFAQAKKIIAAEMVDPGSLQFRNLRIVHGSVQGKALTIACGEYNTKNRLGGYVGFAKFAYEPTLMRGVISLKAEGGMDIFGDVDRNSVAVDTNARILGACLGITQ